ncbi:MAG: rubredoxin [Candidatus Gracilibacteria bacterium]|nr:rubredoxin [Candidatus Gracilibacteria bacterium]
MTIWICDTCGDTREGRCKPKKCDKCNGTVFSKKEDCSCKGCGCKK